MSRIKGTSQAQTIFLRNLHKNPGHLPAELWPSPVILRRWLRRPAFRLALQALRDAAHFRSDLHLSGATCSAAHALENLLQSCAADPAKLAEAISHTHLHALCNLLRLSHTHQRFGHPNDLSRINVFRTLSEQCRQRDQRSKRLAATEKARHTRQLNSRRSLALPAPVLGESCPVNHDE